MDKPVRHKAKNKKQSDKKKTAKKRQSDAPTCSMLLSEMTKRFRQKKSDEKKTSKNIVQTIIESISNALPVKFSKSSPQKKDSPIHIESLQTLAPELLPNDTLSVPYPVLEPERYDEITSPGECGSPMRDFNMPRMPWNYEQCLINSDVFKPAPKAERRVPVVVEDASVNTCSDHDVASEISRHVATLKKISMIAEEFNQKTAKNLKEIVDSVQEDLVKKLAEIRAEKVAAVLAAAAASIAEQSGRREEEKEKKGD